MGVVEGEIFVDLEVELDKEIAVLLVSGDVMDGKAHALRDGQRVGA